MAASSTDGPLYSLTAAQNAVRQLKRENKLSPGGCTVQLHNGVYSISETLTFNEEDSGSDSAAVIWRAAPGEAAVLSGGQEIHGFEPVAEAAVLQRLSAPARPHVLQTNLRTQGISDFGAISEKDGPGLEVFFNDARLQLARYPNAGYLKITSVPKTGAKLINEGSWQWQRFGIPQRVPARECSGGRKIHAARQQNHRRRSGLRRFAKWRFPPARRLPGVPTWLRKNPS